MSTQLLHLRILQLIGAGAAVFIAALALAWMLHATADSRSRDDAPGALAIPQLIVKPPDLAAWEQLRGGAAIGATAMSPPSAQPLVQRALIRQYRAGGERRIYRVRPDGWRPRAIVLHATGGGAPGSGFETTEQLRRFFARESADASAHYAIGRSGDILQLVAVSNAAFHVATPGWNDLSIGIELLNDNSGTDPFPPAQLRATTQLVRTLGLRYGVPVEGVLRHRTVQPSDRRDPASNFPWRSWLRTLHADSAR